MHWCGCVLAPIHDNLCRTFEARNDLVRGDIEVVRVSSVVDEDYLDQLRIVCQVFPEVFEGIRNQESVTLAPGALIYPLDDDTAKDRVDKTSNAQRNCFRYFSGLLFFKFFM